MGRGRDIVDVQEEKREVVILRVLSSKLAIEEAAELLGLSVGHAARGACHARW
jgi:predicted HTH domain antitoxin